MEGLGITLKSAIHLLVLLHVLGGFCVSSHEEWCYDLPKCGPKTWGPLGSCSGSRQSPINIITSDTVTNNCLGPINFFGYENRNLQKCLINTGHYPEVEMWPGATISGCGLPGVYKLRSYHFHFGTYYSPGSEHKINGNRFSMELHLVHTKNNMSMEEAKKDPDGIVVLAFLIEKSQKTQILPGWKTLSDYLEYIPEQNDSIKLNGEFSPGALLRMADTSQYCIYNGSLTTPNCNQSVIWVVFLQPVLVTHKVAIALLSHVGCNPNQLSSIKIKKFTTLLYFTTKNEGRVMQNNFRPTQPLNNRQVYCFNGNAVPDYQNCFGHQNF